MFACSRAIGRLLTGITHPNRSYLSIKYIGVVNISNLRYSSDASNKKPHKSTGTTIKPEDCTFESKYSKSQKAIPPCEAQPDGSCPAYDICKGNGEQKSQNEKDSSFGKNGKNGKYKFRYWHLLAVLIVTGVAGYKVPFWKYEFQQKDKKTKDTTKLRKFRKKVKIPEDSKLIPQEVPYLLIGGGTAAFAAFRSIKSRDAKAKVLVVAEETDFPYMRPPLSKELWDNTDKETTAQLRFNQWNGTQRSIFYEPREFYSNVAHLNESDKGGVAVAMGWKVIKLDVVNKTAILDDGHEIKYNKCLIATGASPKSLPIFESAEYEVKTKITTFRTKDDFLDLQEIVSNPKCKNIVVIGGGFLGSEIACTLARNYAKSKKIVQIYKENSIMAQVLPEYLSKWTTRKAETEGVYSIRNAEVQDYRYKDGQLSLVLTDGQIINTDQVVVAVGVQPNTDLATTSHLETDPNIGGYLVNAELEARSNVWVAGDAACFYDVKLGRRRVEHHDHAVTSGRLAGENMTGAGKPYLHQSMFWSDLGPDVGYEAIGIVDSSLPTVGVFAEANFNPIKEQNLNPKELQSNVKLESSMSQKTKNNDNKSTEENKEIAKDDEKSEKKEIPKDGQLEEQSIEPENFRKGVIFYLRDGTVVGILLWNIFNRMSIARRVLTADTKYDDLNEVAKLFAIHDE